MSSNVMDVIKTYNKILKKKYPSLVELIFNPFLVFQCLYFPWKSKTTAIGNGVSLFINNYNVNKWHF